jgi:hypothetical protein
MARLPSGAATARYCKAGEGAAPGWGHSRRRSPLGLVRPDHDRQARRSYAGGGQRNVRRQMEEPLPALRQWPRRRMSARTRADPMQIGAPGENDPQIQQDDPGEQTQGQTEGEASAPAGAGDWLSRSKN